MRNKLKITTNEQMHRLLDLMEQNPQLVRGIAQFGCSRLQMNETWSRIATELNELGPPTRTTAQWQRVWIHYKSNLKRKLEKKNAELRATDGAPLEERVMKLTHTDKTIDPSEQQLRLIEIDDEDPLATPPSSATSAAPVDTPEDAQTVMLAEEIKIQRKMLAVQRKIAKTSYKMYKLKKQKMKLVVAAMAEEKQLRAVKLEIANKHLAQLMNTNNEKSSSDKMSL